MQSADWTPEQSKALREYVAKGMSYAAIAAAINATFKTNFPATLRSEWDSAAAEAGPIGRNRHRRLRRPRVGRFASAALLKCRGVYRR